MLELLRFVQYKSERNLIGYKNYNFNFKSIGYGDSLSFVDFG